MKKLLSLGFIVLATTIISCHKDTPEPSPANNVQNPQPVQSTLTPREDSLSGYWRLTIKEVYINGIYQSSMSTYYTVTSPYFMTLDTLDVSPQNGNWKKAIDGIVNTPSISQWYCNSNTLHLGTNEYTVVGITTGTLVIRQGSMTTSTATAYTFGRN
jgi:hypothetical protein